MKAHAYETLKKTNFNVDDVSSLLKLNEESARATLFKKANAVKKENVGNIVYYRGLIELSNMCNKNCYYCGIRKDNKNVERYKITPEEAVQAALKGNEYDYGSIVIQAGEVTSNHFVDEIEKLVRTIKEKTNGKIGITLSLGEQSEETYQKWLDAGAHRYLLRIETSNPKLYKKIHPEDSMHNFDKRVECLGLLRKVGYQVGSGIMVGLPFQTIEDVARDLLWLKEMDIDMCGLGPFIEHEDTPFSLEKEKLMGRKERFQLALKSIAILRIMMKDINIASATALQAIDPAGREKALNVGANIIMPNLTPTKFREGYKLYEDKPCMDEEASQCKDCLEARIRMYGNEIGYGKWGDSPHFAKRSNLSSA